MGILKLGVNMNFKSSITVTLSDNNTKLLIPKEVINTIKQVSERDYSAKDASGDYPFKKHTVISLAGDFAMKSGLAPDAMYKDAYLGKQVSLDLKITEDFTIMCGLLKGDKAAEVLFNE